MIEHTSSINVRFCETDAIGIVHHSSYVPWLELARLEMVRAYGLPYKVLNAEGVHMPVLSLGLDFKLPLYYDDKVDIRTWIGERPKTRVRIEYELSRGDEKIATGHSVHAFINEEGRAIRPPETFKSLIENHF